MAVLAALCFVQLMQVAPPTDHHGNNDVLFHNVQRKIQAFKTGTAFTEYNTCFYSSVKIWQSFPDFPFHSSPICFEPSVPMSSAKSPAYLCRKSIKSIKKTPAFHNPPGFPCKIQGPNAIEWGSWTQGSPSHRSPWVGWFRGTISSHRNWGVSSPWKRPLKNARYLYLGSWNGHWLIIQLYVWYHMICNYPVI